MITLLIIDCQWDFIKGNLAVKGATKAILNIIDFITKNKEQISNIIFTVDWHPYNHCSFKKYNGEWPVHCVAYSKGASIDEALFNKVLSLNIPYTIVTKGNIKDKEEYGALSRLSTRRDYLNSNKDIVVCGIAGDYCVLETLRNILEYNPKVLIKGIASIDDGTTLNKFIKVTNLKILE